MSKRGTKIIVHEGYSYGLQNFKNAPKKYWHCTTRRQKCKARVIMNDDKSLLLRNSHNHAPQYEFASPPFVANNR